MATYEGKWRCLHCAAANLGRFLNCQTCGVKRSETVEFFLEDDAAAVADEDLLKKAHAGADWICLYCTGNNRALDSQCSSCGSQRSDENKQLIEETRGVNDWSESAQKAAAAANFATDDSPAAPSFFRSRLFKAVLLGAAGLAVIGIFTFAVFAYISTLTYPVEIEVTGLEWKRAIALEEYRTVTEKAWEGEVPQGARVQSSENALHHTDKIPNGTRTVPETYTERVSDGTESYVCGKTSKKNGFFTDKRCTRTKYKSVTRTRNRTETIYKDVPVFKTRYTYLIDKWMPGGEKTLSGTDFNPQWAVVQTDQTHREGRRTEIYNLLCKELGGKNESLKIKLTPENWANFKNGAHLHGKIDFYGKLLSIDEIPNAAW